MLVTIRPTVELVDYYGQLCHVWQGRTGDGKAVRLFVAAIFGDGAASTSQIIRHLKDVVCPRLFQPEEVEPFDRLTRREGMDHAK